MKNTLFFTCLIFIFSCEKDKLVPIYEPGEMTFGWVEAKKNGRNFLASGIAFHHATPSNGFWGLSYGTETSEGFRRESISLNEITYQTGTFQVSGRSDDLGDGFVGGFYATLEDDGDVLGDVYFLDESKDNTLTITEIDTTENFVKGYFDVSFLIELDEDGKKDNPSNPDKVHFSNATFEVFFFE